MKQTYKIKHNQDLTKELLLARKVAEFAIVNRDKLSTKYVAHIGLKSPISCQILRKYGRNNSIKVIHSVPLILAGQKHQPKNSSLWISELKLMLKVPSYITKVNQIELDKTYAYITYEVDSRPLYTPETHIGIDLNTTGHCAVVAIKETGKVYKLGKKAEHIHKKYSKTRKHFQKKGLYSVVAKIKHRESNIVRDLNHKISRKIVDVAVSSKGGIQLENLEGIRKRKATKNFKYALNSWSFYQLGKFIEYKALLAGVPVAYVNPAYTSKSCSRCGLIGDRNDKSFKCPKGHVENADVNAAFNIALISDSISKLQKDRDFCKGNSVSLNRQLN